MLTRNIWKISVALASCSATCEQSLPEWKFTGHLISANRISVTVTPQICTKEIQPFTLKAPEDSMPLQWHTVVKAEQRKICSSLFPQYKQSHESNSQKSNQGPTFLNIAESLLNRMYLSNLLLNSAHKCHGCLIMKEILTHSGSLQYVQTCLSRLNQQISCSLTHRLSVKAFFL